MRTNTRTNIITFEAKPKKPSQGMTEPESKKPVAYANNEISDIPFTPIHAMMEYVADQLHISETLVHDIITTAFFIDHIDQLPVQDYQSALNFLIRLRCRAVGNPPRQLSN